LSGRPESAPGPGHGQDPVCGMAVDPAAAGHRSEHAGHAYYFCSNRCRERFEADPARYLTPIPVETAGRTATAGLWTCPIHPQIVRDEPGGCPICGMALEPTTPSATDGASPELHDMTRRFWVGAALSLPLIAIAMASDFIGPVFAPRAAGWVQLLLATPAVLWCGWPFFRRGWVSIVRRRLNMFTLIALGTGVTYA